MSSQYHGLHGSTSPVLSATGFVNGRWWISTPTESTPLNRSPKHLSHVITSASPTAVPNLAHVHPRGLLDEWVKYNWFLANVNVYMLSPVRLSSVCLSVCRLSVVCNARAPYSGGSTFRQYFYGIWYPSHPLTSTKNFTEIVPGEPLRRGS